MSAPKPMPAHMVAIRQQICRRCDEPCASHRAGQIDHAHPHAACPRAWSGRWGCYGRCGDPTITRSEPVSAASHTSQVAPPTAPSVSIIEKARHLVGALNRWAKVGFRLVPKLRRLQRRSICRACPSYKPTGNLWLGECTDPKCGCTRFKEWLPTERCPQGKWPA